MEHAEQIVGLRETAIRCNLLLQEYGENLDTREMAVISKWLTFQDIEKLKSDMTLHILPYHFLFQLFRITVCHCTKDRAENFTRFSRVSRYRNRTATTNSTYLLHSELQFLSQQELDDSAGVIELTKSNAELLTSRLKKLISLIYLRQNKA